MRLRSEVHNGVNFLSLKHISNQLRATDIALNKFVVRILFDVTKVLQAGTICLVE